MTSNVAEGAPSGLPSGVPASALVRPIATALLKGRDTIYRTTGAFILVVIFVSFVLPRTFTADGEFVPQSGRSPGSLTGLAAQLGVNLQQGELGQTPEFYSALLDADEFLGWVADDTVPRRPGDAMPRQISAVLGVTEKDDARRRDETVREIRRRLITSSDPKTGIISFTIWAHDPRDAAGIGAAIVNAVDRFNNESRHTQASAVRRSSEQQLVETGKELRDSEDRLQQFLLANREYRSSPDLAFAEDRLARDLALRQQVYTTVSTTYEQAKIDEARDAPAIAVVSHPSAPARADSRHILLRVIVAFFFAFLLSSGLVYAREFGFAKAADVAVSDAYVTFEIAATTLATDMRNPAQTLRRLARSSTAAAS